MSRVRGAGLSNLIVVTCLLVTVLVVGTRDSSIGSDTIAYVRYYDVVRDCRCLVGRYELGFEFLTLLVALTGAPPTVYLSVVAGLLVWLVWNFQRNLVRIVGDSAVVNWKLRIAVLTLILVSPFFFSASVNVLRHGLSAFMILNCALLIQRKRWVQASGLGIAAILFHRTAVLYLVLLPVWTLLNTPRARRLVVTTLIVLAAAYGLRITEEAVRSVSSLTGLDVYTMVKDYGLGATHYRRGTRWDFLLFSMAWFVFGVMASKGWIKFAYRTSFRTLVDLYGLMLIPFLLFGWGSFSDRFLFVPWQLIPVIVGGVVTLGRLRLHSKGIPYLLGLLGASLGLVLSVTLNQSLISWVLRGIVP